MNLVIGNTSQQSHFYPDDYVKISSRDINLADLGSQNYDSVYIPFAEQRIYDKDVDYLTPNFHKTFDIINTLITKSKKITIFGTCELWCNLSGTIDINTQFDFNDNDYCNSKLFLINKIKKLRKQDSIWNKVVIVHPFYFNSSWRSDYFLFGKIFNSIIKRKKIEVGSLDFYRDMVHTEFFVEKVIESKEDILIGSGRLFNVKDFIYDLYLNFGMNPEEYLIVNKNYKVNEKFLRPKVDWNYTYNDLLQQTIKDIKKKI